VALIEGRFFEVPNSGVQSLEARANLSLALGSPRTGEFQAGTVGPAVAALVPVSGPLRARGPLVGVRFRRGLGADVASSHLLWNVNCRVLWLTRNDGANVFGVQAGVALSPALRRAH